MPNTRSMTDKAEEPKGAVDRQKAEEPKDAGDRQSGKGKGTEGQKAEEPKDAGDRQEGKGEGAGKSDKAKSVEESLLFEIFEKLKQSELRWAAQMEQAEERRLLSEKKIAQQMREMTEAIARQRAADTQYLKDFFVQDYCGQRVEHLEIEHKRQAALVKENAKQIQGNSRTLNGVDKVVGDIFDLMPGKGTTVKTENQPENQPKEPTEKRENTVSDLIMPAH
jgi:hypothetical protein